MLKDPTTFCIYRKHDYENYLLSMMLPGSFRDLFWVLRAFNVETAAVSPFSATTGHHHNHHYVQNYATKSATARMRIAYWKDEINDIYKTQKVVYSSFT